MLELRNLTCLRDDRPVFKPVSAVFAPGQIVQIAGPNGAGKTTLLRALCGLYDAIEGEILWHGRSIQQDRDAFFASLLYLGHQPGIKKALSARENLAWYAGLQGKTLPHLETVLAEVGLKGYADVPCHAMSAGQHRRVGLARLYWDNSPLWVLDEPLTAIDVQGVARLEARIQARAADQGLVILTTHQPLQLPGLQTLSLEPYSPVGGKSRRPNHAIPTGVPTDIPTGGAQ